MENLISDFARFYILTILYEGPIHGYQIITIFKRRVGKSLSPGLVYPFLQKLEDKGLISYEVEMVGEKERKIYSLTDEGVELCNRLFTRFAHLISTAIEPSLEVCAHCGCKVYEGAHKEIIDGEELAFCCVHCARSYREEAEASAVAVQLNV
jgi:DNA-binding PadR family transcriptional regulator